MGDTVVIHGRVFDLCADGVAIHDANDMRHLQDVLDTSGPVVVGGHTGVLEVRGYAQLGGAVVSVALVCHRAVGLPPNCTVHTEELKEGFNYASND